MKNILKKITFTLVAIIALTSCEDEFEAKRSNQLLILGSDEVSVGEFNVFGVNDFSGKLEYSWSVSGSQPSETSGSGREAEVAFDSPGTYVVTFTQGGRTGSLQVEVTSKLIGLAGDTTVYRETNTIDTVGFQVNLLHGFGDNEVTYASGEVSVSYVLGGTAVEGVDYELLSDNPILLTADSEDEDYFIYVRFFNDNVIDEIGNTVKYVTATITSVATEIEEEVVLDEDDYLTSGFGILDDRIEVSIADTDTLNVTGPNIIQVQVVLSGEPLEDVTVNYLISGVGVSDVTPTGAGSITFAEGETSKVIYLQFSNAAFAADQFVALTLTGISTVDNEVELGEPKKVFKIEIE
jgi:hypothetical protein